jgi:hypothetical protein
MVLRDKKQGSFETRIGWTVYEFRNPKYFKFSVWLGFIVAIIAGIFGILGFLNIIRF